jgi:hypothetical protein
LAPGAWSVLFIGDGELLLEQDEGLIDPLRGAFGHRLVLAS